MQRARLSFVVQFGLSLTIAGSLFTPSVAQPRADLPASVPDLCQTDPGFHGGGDQYCAPAAVSNSLWWLAKNGFPKLAAASQVQMAQTLAKQMGTDNDGTGPAELIKGLQAYLQSAGYTGKIAQRGWRQTRPSMVDESYLLSALGPSGAAWVNLGWYNQSGSTFTRGGGHWVTLVGAKRVSNGLVLQVHDPSPRAGAAKRTDTLVLEKLSAGELVGKKKGLPRGAAGSYKVKSGLDLPSRYNAAIIDSAVSLKL